MTYSKDDYLILTDIHRHTDIHTAFTSSKSAACRYFYIYTWLAIKWSQYVLCSYKYCFVVVHPINLMILSKLKQNNIISSFVCFRPTRRPPTDIVDEVFRIFVQDGYNVVDHRILRHYGAVRWELSWGFMGGDTDGYSRDSRGDR